MLGATDRAALTVELYPAIRTFLGDGERLLRAKAGPGRAEGGGPAALEDRSPSLLEALSRWSTRGSPSLSGSPGQGPHPIAGPLSAHLDTFLRHDFLPEAYTALQSRLLAILEADDAERGGVPEARARLEAAEELVRTALQWSSAVAPCGPDLQGMAENVLGAVLDAVARPALQAACAPLGPAAAAALSLPWAQRMALEPAAKLLWSLDAFACEDGGADGAKPQVEALGGGGGARGARPRAPARGSGPALCGRLPPALERAGGRLASAVHALLGHHRARGRRRRRQRGAAAGRDGRRRRAGLHPGQVGGRVGLLLCFICRAALACCHCAWTFIICGVF
ncbi:hypothetical protein QBZ16_004427 [Prototheca wickerhamii]|uniref:Uncharacterized protein n=1 Tax=Prototheca wickerhamii TaxID=3111 RepID=A0AAD9MHZ2_PROWI|nr:hypothetical protein QBZ16_004427 [Prototheca wickerhamii]